MSDNDSFYLLVQAQRMRHVSAYIKQHKTDPLWNQIAKLLDSEAHNVIHDTLNALKNAPSTT
jgi:hypothetical protein